MYRIFGLARRINRSLSARATALILLTPIPDVLAARSYLDMFALLRVTTASSRSAHNCRAWLVNGWTAGRCWLGSTQEFARSYGRPARYSLAIGLTTVKSGKREKSLSADQSTRTP